MATVTINGKTYTGSSVAVTNNKVYIDGILQDAGEEKQIIISVGGDVQALSVDACTKISITGNCGSVQSASGDIACGNVSGNVLTVSGDVKAKNISGSVKTVSGDIECNSHN
jgi:hypothetical protein